MGEYDDAMYSAPTEDGCEWCEEPTWVDPEADPKSPMRCVFPVDDIPQGSRNCEDLKRDGECPCVQAPHNIKTWERFKGIPKKIMTTEQLTGHDVSGT